MDVSFVTRVDDLVGPVPSTCLRSVPSMAIRQSANEQQRLSGIRNEEGWHRLAHDSLDVQRARTRRVRRTGSSLAGRWVRPTKIAEREKPDRRHRPSNAPV
jgi:hypothetical protein